MTCAKVHVYAELYVPSVNLVFSGTNECLEPQEECPREPGEGYAKCVSICKQPGHAESMAISLAKEFLESEGKGTSLKGSHMTVGYDRVCDMCQTQMTLEGITWECRPPLNAVWDVWQDVDPGKVIMIKSEDSIPIVVDTGKRYNQGKLRYSLVSEDALEGLVKVLEFGAKKYGENNWQRGIGNVSVVDSLMRHVHALLRGEVNDSESGLPHIDHVQCNAMFLSHYLADPEKYGAFNDFPKP